MAPKSFRFDINGLRAWAVLAVVLFHFDPAWLPGGFAGVDIFFVISGFLMTGIIFRGIENGSFSLAKFYRDRAARIIPALSVLCGLLLIFGAVFLYPTDFEVLGKHVFASLGFFSNLVYWQEAGYFDVASHEKWLLHTWSLSVEWQFYILYPLALISLSRFLSLNKLRWLLLVGTLVAFLFGCLASYQWTNAAYFLLPTRAWEMMLGGLAFAFPVRFSPKKSIALEVTGFALIAVSILAIDSETAWPGYLAAIPTIGAYLVIVAHRQHSPLTNNALFQRIGKHSYSIYLWHWPIIVFGHHFDLDNWWMVGLPLSFLFGWLSYRYIESFKISERSRFRRALISKPTWSVLAPGTLGMLVYATNGAGAMLPQQIIDLQQMANASPYRDRCHVSEYQAPEASCAYFAPKVTWAVLGDSHTVELAYALAQELKKNGEGLKHFSFSSCPPSFGQGADFSRCSGWYDEAVAYIADNPDITHVVIAHRWSLALWGDNIDSYPEVPAQQASSTTRAMASAIDETVRALSKTKERVFVMYPVPELGDKVHDLIYDAHRQDAPLDQIRGTTLDYYQKRNKFILDHFDRARYPENARFIKPADTFCDSAYCYAVKNGQTLYFDDDHPSLTGAGILAKQILSAETLVSRN